MARDREREWVRKSCVREHENGGESSMKSKRREWERGREQSDGNEQSSQRERDER